MGKLFDAFEGLVEEQEPAGELEHTPEDSLHVYNTVTKAGLLLLRSENTTSFDITEVRCFCLPT